MENIGRFGAPLNDPAHRSFGKAPIQAVLDDAPTLPNGFPALRAPRHGEPRLAAFRMTGARTSATPMTRARDLPPYTGPVTGEQYVLDPVTEAEMLAERQTAATAPAYTGPETGEQFSSPEVVAALGEIQRDTHSHRRTGREPLLRRHGQRFASFSVIGAVVFGLGVAVQWILVRAGAGYYGSYAAQAVFSIELSFALSRAFTWGDRRTNLWLSCWRFNAQKLALTVPNLGLYALLVQLGAGWLVANVAVTAVFTVANYVTGDLWSFAASRARSHRRDRRATATAMSIPPLPDGPLPSVSIVIPCKGNERTIRATVGSLLGQDYPALAEVILVGDVGDSTWAALSDVTDPRLIMLEQEKTPGQRDPNVKRHKGLLKARGDVLALADSDIVMDPDWLSTGVALLAAQGGGLVAGGMRAIHPHRYWPRFVDRNSLAAKTSRLSRPYFMTTANFGARGRKPPLTANALFTRDLYDSCPLDVAWAYGYEDYEWYWRLAKAKHTVQYNGALTAAHHHREKFGQLIREYRRSAQGCAEFIRRHPDSPLARKRRGQAAVLPVSATVASAAAAVAIATGFGAVIATMVAVGLTGLAVREGMRSRSLEALAYPAAAFTLGGVFAVTLAGSLLRPGERSAPAWDKEDAGRATQPLHRAGEKRSPRYVTTAVTTAILFAGFVTRFLGLASKPNWQVDEVTYYAIAKNLLQNHQLSLPTPYGLSWQPFLWHPPLYFILLSRWFALVGAGVYQARILGVIAATVTLAILSRVVYRAYGRTTSVVCTLFLATDGWLLYIQRCSYIENVLMLAGVGTVLAYQAALRTDNKYWYVIAGALGGFTAVFKHTGAYILFAILIHWVMTRKNHRNHAILSAVAATVIATYAVSMVHAWGSVYESQTLTQAERVTGFASSEGTLTSPIAFVQLMTEQYAVFWPSLIAGLAGIFLVFRDLYRSVRGRTLLFSNSVIAAWVLSGVVIFGASDIKYPQYFEMVLIPAYIYLWSTCVRAYDAGKLRSAMATIAAGIVVVLGLASFTIRSTGNNPLAEAAAWMTENVPQSAVVSAESPLGYDIPQQYCKPYEQSPPTVQCEENTQYIISWVTDLQSDNPRHYPGITAMLARSHVLATFSDFQGTIYIREVDR
jgi:4-amino-4-deoxy-L-arabinose transferase-like glycosyltransferase/putative flippase GtrA